MTVAPPTLTALQARLVNNLHTVNLGIVGDASHVATGGYHIGAKSLRAAGMGGDYSLEYSLDSMSNTDYACAIDVGGSAELLMTLGTRLVHALKAHDPRVYGKIRATNAPWDGQSIDRRFDCESPSTGADDNTQSSSDRGHIHIEFYRTLILNQSVMDGLYSVLAGVPASSTPPPTPTPVPGKKLYQGQPVPYLIRQGSNQYLGSISGPYASHGGANANEQYLVKMLQQRLIVCGFVPGHTNPNDGWADGIFDTRTDRPGTGVTSQAVARFQARYMPGTRFPGQVWYDDWTKLFNL